MGIEQKNSSLFRYSGEYIPPSESLRIANFIDAYAAAIAGPILLGNHTTNIVCESSPKHVQSRTVQLGAFLATNKLEAGIKTWCSTIYAEAFATGMIIRLYQQAFEREGYQLLLSPWTLDISEDNPHQKGADAIVVSTRDKKCGTVGTGICGFDYTLGDQETVARKRARLGFQARAAIPVFVIPLLDLFTDKRDDGRFVLNHLNTFGRQSVRELGKVQPDFGISSTEFGAWGKGFHQVIQKAVQECQVGLSNVWGEQMEGYQYARHVMDLIELSCKLF